MSGIFDVEKIEKHGQKISRLGILKNQIDLSMTSDRGSTDLGK